MGLREKRYTIVPRETIPVLESDNSVTLEEKLPYPIVHYPSSFLGVYCGFQEIEESPIYYCSCQKKSMEVFLTKVTGGFRAFPKSFNSFMTEHIFQTILFKDTLCHVCNKVCPTYAYGKEFNQTKFHYIYGRYIKALAYEYGIDDGGYLVSPELIPQDIVPQLITSQFDDTRLDEQSRRDFERYCENVIRLRMGYYEIGKKWATEITLLETVKNLYPDYTVIHQYELDHLRADIYIEELELVIEYQGEQHFKAFDYMGGKKALAKTQARDKEKAELCNFYNLGLLYFTYKDDLSKKSVKKRIADYVKKHSELK